MPWFVDIRLQGWPTNVQHRSGNTEGGILDLCLHKRLSSDEPCCDMQIWDPNAGRCVHTLQGHSGDVDTVSWSPNGARLASSSDDHTVKVSKYHDQRLASVVPGCLELFTEHDVFERKLYWEGFCLGNKQYLCDEPNPCWAAFEHVLGAQK